MTVGAPAHGGSCVARFPDGPGGRVLFVRHALPGERARVLVTEDRGGSFAFADAVEILSASPDRVTPPCPHSGPGRCGGCDWQHAGAAAQLELKSTVVREQFDRLAGLPLGELFAGVEPLPGGLLGWRTRTLYAVGRDGRPGLRRHRSHEVEVLDRCPLGAAGVGDAGVLDETWDGVTGVEVAIGTADGAPAGEPAVLTHRPAARRGGRGRRAPDRVALLRGPQHLRHTVSGRDFDVHAGGFWQVHPAAAAAFAEALLGLVAPRPGEAVLDLYAGAGALTAPLAEAVGPTGRVLGLEADAVAVTDGRANLEDLPQAELRHERVTAGVLGTLDAVDVVVLDPPRSGAGREVVQALLDLRPRCVGYVACDPAALARDVATAVGAGWRLTGLRAFDAFPMTHHVECVARLEPDDSRT
ncbi:MAG: class I SAM-dependent RNA methyltransferase [Jatrophihabitans endophyticus]|nr:class I SAM-dependent RNA methyltransferase [Jatrophihabitans endophyticus]